MSNNTKKVEDDDYFGDQKTPLISHSDVSDAYESHDIGEEPRLLKGPSESEKGIHFVSTLYA